MRKFSVDFHPFPSLFTLSLVLPPPIRSRPQSLHYLFIQKTNMKNVLFICLFALFYCCLFIWPSTWTTSFTSLLDCLLYLLNFHSRCSIVIQLIAVIITYTTHALCANLSIRFFIYLPFFPQCLLFLFIIYIFLLTYFSALCIHN